MREKPKVGVLTFTDPRNADAPDQALVGRLLDAAGSYRNQVLEILAEGGCDIVSSPIMVSSNEEAVRQAREIRESGGEAVILHLPMWTQPNLAVIATRIANLPCMVVTNQALTGGLVIMLAVAGALDQIGIPNRRVWSDSREELTRAISSFVRAVHASNKLQGQTYGVFGGRSLGIVTATADPSQWMNMFGIDVAHVDQLEIVRKAEDIPAERIQRFIDWLEENVGWIGYDDKVFTKERLERQVRSYLATKQLALNSGFDFVGVKCQTELSDEYVNQCLTPAFMNDIADDEGEKEPVVCACEADHDGALTMQILKLISAGKPTTLMDFQYVELDTGVCAFANCGGMAPWFAARSDIPAVNYREVHLYPQIQGRAGGGATQFVSKGGPVTLSRLCRRAGRYVMYILRAEALDFPREKLRNYVWPWPYVFAKLESDPGALIQEFGSNHIHAVAGDYVDELKEFCRLMKIEPVTSPGPRS